MNNKFIAAKMKKGDVRRNGVYGEKDFLRHISKFRKYENVPRGEKSVRAKLTAEKVFKIRAHNSMPRKLAYRYSSLFGIAWAYVYQLRRKKNGHYMKWRHLEFQNAMDYVIHKNKKLYSRFS